MTRDQIRELALSLPLVEEKAHFDGASFRVKGKIFATLPPHDDQLVLKLPSEIKQSLQQTDASALMPLPGAWGRGGWTLMSSNGFADERMADLVRLAWRTVAPKALLKETP